MFENDNIVYAIKHKFRNIWAHKDCEKLKGVTDKITRARFFDRLDWAQMFLKDIKTDNWKIVKYEINYVEEI